VKRVVAWVRQEPVRVWMYGTLAPALGVLFVYGILSATQVAAWLALGAGLLAVPAVETARSKVSPVRTDPPA
jgi:hypothetical protein